MKNWRIAELCYKNKKVLYELQVPNSHQSCYKNGIRKINNIVNRGAKKDVKEGEDANDINKFLNIFDYEKESDTEFKRIDELSKYIEVVKLNKKPLNDTKYYNKYDFSNIKQFFDEHGKLDLTKTSKKELKREKETNSIESDDIIEYIHIPPFVLTKLSEYAFREILFFLNKKHLQQLRNILEDSEASKNDKYVAMTLLKNAVISSQQLLPGCQDTGTAIIMGKKDEEILTTRDHEYLNLGVFNAYKYNHFRYSQLSPVSMFNEVNTKNNLPAQIEIYSDVRQTSETQQGKKGDTAEKTEKVEKTENRKKRKMEPKYELLFIAKGGGSANKTFLYQQTKSILHEKHLYKFLLSEIKKIGTSACPPYHLAIVIGGLSAEMNLKMLKLASCRYLDNIITEGGTHGKGFRDIKSEQIILQKCHELGIGAQFGGKYFVHDVRVIRLPRHSASCPISIGVSCSADRQIKCIINKEGVFMEQLEHEPIKYIPEVTVKDLKHTDGIKIDLNKDMSDTLNTLSKYPVATLLLLSGKLVVARDTAHKRIVDQFINEKKPIPEYFKKYPIYYAGPAKTPTNYACGSFGPTTAGRMDAYAETLMKNEASLITLAKGNRSSTVTNACKKYNGFYLGSIGGPGAILAKNNITNVQVIDFKELGMEAVHLIDVVDFPAFIVIDNKGNDFYSQWIPQ